MKKEHSDKITLLENKLASEALAHRESAKASENALIRLREVMDVEREEQIQELLQEKESAVRATEDRFKVDALRHKENHKQVRAQLTAAHDRLAALEVRLFLCFVT